MENNISIFEILYQNYKINKPIRLIELFAGIGSQAMALRNIGANFEHYRVIEYDGHAIKSYNTIHDTNFKTYDITKVNGADLGIVDINDFVYIMTYSFPCQDLSIAGNMAGMSRGSGTRSGLLWEVERLLSETKELPQVMLMENVPQVISDDNIDDFHEWIIFLENKGYKNYVKKLNARDYGIAQNRERAFMVSILGDYNYTFPSKKNLNLSVFDYLEHNVDKKYYIDINAVSRLILFNGVNDNGQEYVAISQATEKGFAECIIGGVANLSFPSSMNRRGRTIDNGLICPTLTTGGSGIYRIEGIDKIRKIIPVEAWRLMGFNDRDFIKAQTVNNNTQLMKQAGNSIACCSSARGNF